MTGAVGSNLVCLALLHKALYTQLTGLSQTREFSVQTIFSGLYCHKFTHFEIGNFQVLIIVTVVHLIK